MMYRKKIYIYICYLVYTCMIFIDENENFVNCTSLKKSRFKAEKISNKRYSRSRVSSRYEQ